jgi:hypothetical protein
MVSQHLVNSLNLVYPRVTAQEKSRLGQILEKQEFLHIRQKSSSRSLKFRQNIESYSISARYANVAAQAR